MKKLIKKILKEEIDDFDWIRDNSISGDQLRDLILQTGATSIPFDRVEGYLDLGGTPIKDLGNLQSVGGYLYLGGTPIKDLGNLQSVEGYLNLWGTPIQDLGNLQSVGGFLNLTGTPLAKKYSKAEIRQMVQVGGNIYM
jgi:hypothetical protein